MYLLTKLVSLPVNSCTGSFLHYITINPWMDGSINEKWTTGQHPLRHWDDASCPTSGEESRDHQAENMTLCVCSPAWHVWVTHWRVCLPFWKLARLFGHLTHHRIILNKQILEKTNFGYETNLKNRSYTQHFHTDCGWPDQGPRTWDNVRGSPKERLPSWL